MVFNSPFHRSNWERCKVLIVDEISMVDSALFEKLEYIARIVRGVNFPFGGIQLILSGDFFQLPPIQRIGATDAPLFCFESPYWPKCITSVIELKGVFRQSDPIFVNFLNQIRHGILDDKGKALLESCKGREFLQDVIEPTVIYPYNKDVDEINHQKLKEITSRGKLYKAKDKGKSPHLELLQSHCAAPSELKLKVGCQVLLLKNSKRKNLVNGLRGVVIGFDETKRGYPRVFFGNGEEATVEPERWAIEVNGLEVASREQVPLKLAWAISIHKCQGMSISRCELSLAGVFEYGQSYVALSRVSSLEGLRIVDYREKSIRAHPKVIEFYSTFSEDKSSLQAGKLVQQKTAKLGGSNIQDQSFVMKAEYALSARSNCKHCQLPIAKDELRLGKLIQSTKFEGIFPLWMHYQCFFGDKSPQKPSPFPQKPPKVKSTNEIEGYDLLKEEDKKKICNRFGLKEEPKANIPIINNDEDFSLDMDEVERIMEESKAEMPLYMQGKIHSHSNDFVPLDHFNEKQTNDKPKNQSKEEKLEEIDAWTKQDELDETEYRMVQNELQARNSSEITSMFPQKKEVVVEKKNISLFQSWKKEQVDQKVEEKVVVHLKKPALAKNSTDQDELSDDLIEHQEKQKKTARKQPKKLKTKQASEDEISDCVLDSPKKQKYKKQKREEEYLSEEEFFGNGAKKSKLPQISTNVKTEKTKRRSPRKKEIINLED
eukprot:TRINITY_DN3367_c0_g2_i2.p1 TRINITY_DN3367_c0_g2~~TRINITY_DN3367_c0_g2_i2.p1  ORF type:complete len:715 (-),score=172.83 TRINITY_DN3367_c0_g2_i2:1883-4027(-)